MGVKKTSGVNIHNRRSFIKTNAALGLGAIASASVIVQSCTDIKKTSDASDQPPADLLAKYQECLGGPFPDPVPLNPVLRETIKKDGYRIESITFEVLPGDRIPALILIPDNVTSSNPAPGIAVWHQHNGEYHLGNNEPAGLAGNPMHHTAVALVREGYVVLCPDSLCFEERQDPTGILKRGEYERFEFLREVVRGRSLAWRDVLDMKTSVTYLSQRPEVIPDKLGCYGHSMGSTHAWLVGPLEPRLKCVIGNCCLPTYDAIEATHILHCFPNFVPGWKKYGDTPEIAAMIAPRALHLNFGEKDTGSPIEFVKTGLIKIAEAYNKAGVPENFTSYIEPGAEHVLSDEMWQRVKECFAKHLKTA
ncbi:MAG: dienelactone hydrolase family protein [Bacteroidia bacterium]|nr:dienelactone hydrolase family protein [Bacteroidia bacterium]